MNSTWKRSGGCFWSSIPMQSVSDLLHLCQSMPLFGLFSCFFKLFMQFKIVIYISRKWTVTVVKYYLILTKLFNVPFKSIALSPGLKHFSVRDSNRYEEGLETTQTTSLQAVCMYTREWRKEWIWKFYEFKLSFRSVPTHLAPIVQRVDKAIHRINHYPVDSVICFDNAHLLAGDLSGG